MEKPFEKFKRNALKPKPGTGGVFNFQSEKDTREFSGGLAVDDEDIDDQEDEQDETPEQQAGDAEEIEHPANNYPKRRGRKPKNYPR